MRNRTLIISSLLLVAGLLLPAAPALANQDPPGDGVVIWNEDYTLGEDEQLGGDLVVFNGDATLEPGSRVQGAVVIWGGDADVEGTIEGEIVVSDGNIYLGEGAWVQGNVVCSLGCDLEREEGARVNGQIFEGLSLRGLPLERWRFMPRAPIQLPAAPMWMSGPRQVLEWMLKVIRGLVTVLVIAAVGGLVGLIWPQATVRVGQTVLDHPGPSLGIGFLAMVAAVALIVALVITICFAPAAALVAIALGAAGLFGWIAIGTLVGRRLMQTLNVDEPAPLWTAGAGTLIITLISAGLSAALCLAPLGWLLTFALSCFGLGAVALTRFGTMPYAPGQPGQPTPPAPPTPPPAPVAEDSPEPTGEKFEEDTNEEAESV